MTTKPTNLVAVLAALLVLSPPMLAHHGFAAYDMTESRSVQVTITGFELANPHSRITFDLKDASGNLESWTVESVHAVGEMKQAGWNFDSLKPGDQVTVNFHPAKGGAHKGVLIDVVIPAQNISKLLIGLPKGAWVALSKDESRVVAYAPKLSDAMQKAREAGESSPVLVRVPQTEDTVLSDTDKLGSIRRQPPASQQ